LSIIVTVMLGSVEFDSRASDFSVSPHDQPADVLLKGGALPSGLWGLADETRDLIDVGNGQYHDTLRALFLSPASRGELLGVALGPAAVTALLRVRRRNPAGRNGVIHAALGVLMVVGVCAWLTACSPSIDPPQLVTLPTISTQQARPTQLVTPTLDQGTQDPPPTQTPTSTPTHTSTPTPVPSSIHLSGVPLYSQLTTRPVTIVGKSVTTKWSSCGPTALAMILNYQRAGPTPQDLVDYAVGAGLYLPHDPQKVYTSPQNLYRAATNYGVPTSGNVTKDDTSAQALLREKLSHNLPVIVDVTVELVAGGGKAAHFVVVTGIDSGHVYVNDPYSGGTGGTFRTIPWKDFFWAWQNNSDAPKHNGGGWWMTVSPNESPPTPSATS
jgi:predicted double-glycine peptidase